MNVLRAGKKNSSYRVMRHHETHIREQENGSFLTDLRLLVERLRGEWAVEEQENNTCAVYVSDEVADGVEDWLGERGYEYEGDSDTVFAELGAYMKFSVGRAIDSEKEFMFRVSLKEEE